MPDENNRAAISAELARLLIEERKRCGLSMNRLSETAGLSQSLISDYEAGKCNLRLDTLLRIAQALKVNAGQALAKAINNIESKRSSPSSTSGKVSKKH